MRLFSCQFNLVIMSLHFNTIMKNSSFRLLEIQNFHVYHGLRNMAPYEIVTLTCSCTVQVYMWEAHAWVKHELSFADMRCAAKYFVLDLLELVILSCP